MHKDMHKMIADSNEHDAQLLIDGNLHYEACLVEIRELCASQEGGPTSQDLEFFDDMMRSVYVNGYVDGVKTTRREVIKSVLSDLARQSGDAN